MKIIDNFLTKKDLFVLKNVFLGAEFPWFYNDGVVGTIDQDFQFTHVIYKDLKQNSTFFNLMDPFIKKLKILSLIRIKANLLTKTYKIIEHGLHTDQHITNNNKLKTAVFYFNTNNGYTKFKDGTKIESKENRMVVFDNNILHTGSSCTDEKIRVVLNINYIEHS